MWLPVWHKRSGFGPILAFNLPSSLRLIIFSFRFQVRDVLFFHLLKHLEALYKVVKWPNLNIVLSQGIGKLEDRERDEEQLVDGRVRTYTFIC